MIYYDTEDFFGTLFKLKGSALKGPGPRRSFVMSMLALGVAGLNWYHPFVIKTRESTAFVDTLVVFNVFLGLMISFRLNAAFQQWRAGVVAIGSLAEAARGLISSACAFIDMEDQVELRPKCIFLTELRRLVILYIANVFHDCRRRDNIEEFKELDLMNEEEFNEIHTCGAVTSKAQIECSPNSLVQANPHKLRATIMELWIRRAIQKAGRQNLLTPPQSTLLNTGVSQLSNLYSTVYSIANVPIPFNYAQFLALVIVAYLLLYTLVIVPVSGFYTPLWVFLWGFILFCCDDLANEIECPFGLDDNDIDLEARMVCIMEELTVLVRSQYYSCGLSTLQIPSSSSYAFSDPTFKATVKKMGKNNSTIETSPIHKQPHHSQPVLPSMVSEKFPLNEVGSVPQINEYTPLITTRASGEFKNDNPSSNA